MINPMNREIDKYKVEPYVIAADIYSNTSHKGRGGWTWYTGSAGWAYKIAIEDILGMKKEGKLLDFEPKVPSNWNSFSIKYKYESTLYIINITIKDKAKKTISLDGLKVKELELIDDKIEHNVDIIIGREK
jgi:cellobiose phosphorylase